jgi:nucleoside-diphosphate kinase
MEKNFKNKTLAIIKPGFLYDGFYIQKTIRDNGFKIVFESNVRLTKEEACKFYSEHQGQHYFDKLTDYMSSDDILVMMLEKDDNAVEDFKNLLGATDPKKAAEGTIRRRYGIDIIRNVCHGSKNSENAEKECKFFFGLEL